VFAGQGAQTFTTSPEHAAPALGTSSALSSFPKERIVIMANIAHADTPASFETEVLQSTIPVVVDFWAAWCGPCRTVSPELEKLADAYAGTVKVVKVDVDANGTIANRYGIQGIPTIALFRNGEAVASTVGAKPRVAIEADLGLTPA